jgi:hypothetical protein
MYQIYLNIILYDYNVTTSILFKIFRFPRRSSPCSRSRLTAPGELKYEILCRRANCCERPGRPHEDLRNDSEVNFMFGLLCEDAFAMQTYNNRKQDVCATFSHNGLLKCDSILPIQLVILFLPPEFFSLNSSIFLLAGE